MGKLRFDAAFPISAESKKTERSIKLSGIRHSGQSEKADARGQNGTKHWKQISELLERKLGLTRRIE